MPSLRSQSQKPGSLASLQMTQALFSQDTRSAPLLDAGHNRLSSEISSSPVVAAVFKAHSMQCLSVEAMGTEPPPLLLCSSHPARAALSHPLSQSSTNTKSHSIPGSSISFTQNP